jgi:peptidoglycan/LPS O-acetylase OafA/YrhL
MIANTPLAAAARQSKLSTTTQYRNLDVLRAFAVFDVFLCHIVLMLHPELWIARIALGLGRFGVILFFFHTSFVLMQSMESLRARSGRWPIQFYVRRICRIYPLAIAVIVLAVAVKVPFAPWESFEHPQRNVRLIVANLLLTQNLFGIQSVIAPLWSLPLEVQMYALLPFVYGAVRRNGWKLAMILMWAGAAVSALLADRILDHLNIFAFIPCFLSGALSYKITRTHKPEWSSIAWVPVILAITAGGVAVTLKVPAEWLVCLALAFVFPRIRDMRSGWITNCGRTVAKYSYGIYLFNLIGLWVGFGILGAFLNSPGVRTAISVAVVAVASFLCFHLVEDPLIRVGKQIADRLMAYPSSVELQK